MKDLAYFFATLVILGWVGVLFTMSPEGAENSVLYVAASATLFVGSLGSWVTAIYLWSKVPREGWVHTFALVMLVLFGFLWAHFYVFATGRLVPNAATRG
jgi:ABC-type transport system involved in multi-copper enzyme maturation permease subunit